MTMFIEYETCFASGARLGVLALSRAAILEAARGFLLFSR